MKYSGRDSFACLVMVAGAAACGPHVGKLVVDRWTPLAAGTWSLEPGTEDPAWCRTIFLAEETYIAAMRPLAAPGTHHISLNLASEGDEDDCAAARPGVGTVYAAGPGAGELRMPASVAIRLAAGRALHLRLHVYNPTSETLNGVSGIEIVRTRPEMVKNEAAFALAGPDDVRLPPAKRTTILHTCRIATEQTAFALMPLMHKLGVWFKTTVTQGGEARVLYDGAFRFEEQAQIPIGPLTLAAGDFITTECTYDNKQYHPVSTAHGGEICYSAILRYPSAAPVECPSAADPAPAGKGEPW
jgi:hypothetical protein